MLMRMPDLDGPDLAGPDNGHDDLLRERIDRKVGQ
jgi:hypothetical protein